MLLIILLAVWCKCWICDEYIEGDIKVRDHCHFTGKYRGSALRDCNNIYVKLNHQKRSCRISQKKEIYDSHLIMQKLGKLNPKINVIPNGLEKYMTSSINNEWSFQFPISSLDNLVKHLNKANFKYLSQEFDNNVLDLVKQKGINPYE